MRHMVIIVCGPLDYIHVCLCVCCFLLLIFSLEMITTECREKKKRNTRSEVIKTISMLKVMNRINAQFMLNSLYIYVRFSNGTQH